jgi:hypothetical protein
MSDTRGAAHHIVEWLKGDDRKRETALRYAEGGMQYFANWVQEVLYPPSFLHLYPADAARMIALRDSFTREAFDRIDWPTVWFEISTD